ncbi:MAG: hypothetical protein F7C32_04335 [Desulfurococcales archaeon]|nr:hypothetical protein [Desulfurococcales archaeon]
MVLWPDKRELTAFIILASKTGKTLNLGEAQDILAKELCISRRVARSILKKLRNLGLARIKLLKEEVQVELLDLEEGMKMLAERYATERRLRHNCNV